MPVAHSPTRHRMFAESSSLFAPPLPWRMDDDKPREPELTPDGDVFGAPRKFTYPAPPSFTEEERQRYAEAVNTITNSSSSSVVS